MDKINCYLIKDLLPLYIDDMVSEETKALIKEHLVTCKECEDELSLLNTTLQESPVVVTPNDDATMLKKIGFTMKKKQFFIGAVSTLISAVIIILSFGYLTAPEYLPYTEDLNFLTVTDNNGYLFVSFTGEYELNQRGEGVFNISVYHTLWDQLFNSAKSQTITVNPNGEQVDTIYYLSNNGQEDQVIYGADAMMNAGTVTLPRLFLNYYFIFAILMTLSGIVVFIRFKNHEKLRVKLTYLLFLPASYIMSHLLITCLDGKSYSAPRDLYLILLLSLPIYSLFYLLYTRNYNQKLK